MVGHTRQTTRVASSDLFDALARSFLGARNRSAVYGATVDVVREALGAEVSLVVRDLDGDLVQIASSAAGDHDVASTLRRESVPGRGLRAGRGCVVTDRERLPTAVDSAPLAPYRSIVAIPLDEREVLVVGDTRPNAFDPARVDAITGVATFAAAALESVDADPRPATPNGRLDQVATVLSHDVDNVITVMEGNLELLRDETDREELDAIERGAHRLDQLVADLVTILRTEEADLEIRPVDLREVVGECWELSHSGDTELVCGDLGTIMADESRLRQVFENLLRNAVEHTPEDGTVRVGAMEDGTGVYVEDDGPGVDPADRERVFDYGYSGTGGGTGFGLSIVAWIADTHGWDVRVTAAELGGARFELTGLELDRE